MLEEIRCQTTSAVHLFSSTCPQNVAFSLSCGAIMAANLLAHSEPLQMHTPLHAPSTRTASKRMLKPFNFEAEETMLAEVLYTDWRMR